MSVLFTFTLASGGRNVNFMDSLWIGPYLYQSLPYTIVVSENAPIR